MRLLGHRYYDASTGRFLTRDPIKDGRNWYAYGAGEANPLTMADPTGLELISIPVMGAAVIRLASLVRTGSDYVDRIFGKTASDFGVLERRLGKVFSRIEATKFYQMHRLQLEWSESCLYWFRKDKV